MQTHQPQLADVDVAVIGAGITGLSAAYYLQKAGLSVRVYEGSERVGGNIKSIRKLGHLLEYGPHSAYARASFAELVSELGLESQLVSAPSPQEHRRFIAVKKNGDLKLRPLPRNIRELLFGDTLSLAAKLRVISEMARPYKPAHRKHRADQSVEDLMRTRLGQEFCDTYIATLLSGVWAGEIANMSARSTLPMAWSLLQRYGSLVRGVLKEYSKHKAKRPAATSFLQGMNTIVDTLAAKIGTEHISLNAPIRDLSQLAARRVLITTPARTTASLLADIDHGLASEISEIPYAPIGVVHMSIAADSLRLPKNCSGFLVPPAAKLGLIGVMVPSSTFPKRAPDKQILLTCFAGGAGNPEAAKLDDPSKLNQIVREVRQILEVTTEPQIIDHAYIPRAIPNYPLEHFSLLDKISEFHQQQNRIRIAGNWIKGIGVAHRLSEAKSLAEEISRVKIGSVVELPVEESCLNNETRKSTGTHG